MSGRDVTGTAGRIAVIDLGSNSLRLVVFDRLGGALRRRFGGSGVVAEGGLR